jgi:hypothetical protein
VVETAAAERNKCKKKELADLQALVDIGVSRLFGCYTLNGEVGG